MNVQRPLLKVLLPIVVLGLSIGAAWAMIALRPASMPQPVVPEPPTVVIERVEPKTLQLNVVSQGVVSPREQIDLMAEVAGKVVQIHPALVSGGFFVANELLLTIDTQVYDYAIVAAQARVAEAKRVLINERAQVEQADSEWQALGQGEASDLALRKPQLAEAEAKLQAAEADLAKSKLDRSRCELRAPFSGRVLSKQVGRGQFLAAGSVVAKIFANDVAEVRLPVGIDQLGFLDLSWGRQSGVAGHQPKVSLRASIGANAQHWQGRIVRSEAALDAASGQLFLVAQVDRPDQTSADRAPLLSGLFVQAEIEGVSQPGLFSLPRSALNNLQQLKVVTDEQRLAFRHVEVLRSDASTVIIKAGLNPGERVVVSEMPMAVEGMPVRIAAADMAVKP